MDPNPGPWAKSDALCCVCGCEIGRTNILSFGGCPFCFVFGLGRCVVGGAGAGAVLFMAGTCPWQEAGVGMLAHGAGKYGGQGLGARPHSAGLLEVNCEPERQRHTHAFVYKPRDN